MFDATDGRPPALGVDILLKKQISKKSTFLKITNLWPLSTGKIDEISGDTSEWPQICVVDAHKQRHDDMLWCIINVRYADVDFRQMWHQLSEKRALIEISILNKDWRLQCVKKHVYVYKNQHNQRAVAAHVLRPSVAVHRAPYCKYVRESSEKNFPRIYVHFEHKILRYHSGKWMKTEEKR